MNITAFTRVFRPGIRTMIAGMVLVFLIGCSGMQTSLPPITQENNNEQLVGKMVWFDLVTSRPEKAKDFYETVFGWKFIASQDDYSLIKHEGIPIGGMAVISEKDPDIQGSLWLLSLSVKDVNGSAQFISEKGGIIIEPPSYVSKRGTMAVVKDPFNAFLVLLKAEGGDPPDAEPAIGRWGWADFFTRDVEKALDVYGGLSEYTIISEKPENNNVHHIFKKDGKFRGGVVEMPFKDLEANWVPYVFVENLDQTIETSKASGGSLMIRDGNAAVLLDPAGAAVGIKEYVTVKRAN